ncbi:transcriptional regulator [Haladaptatus sp. W1]|uniref:IclR family transcriptional regulator n=1 Tax=Haladaptatus sp. W1 TaxID=1897478 RepID=UPI000849B765|nr:IclR family transcriptional regulator [Haladaptatus sp. W1]ODR82499.1 transcriptional regulator [Haladaptatus sp. W1]
MPNYPVGATATTFEIIDSLATLERAGVTQLADRLGRSKGSVHNHLATLERLGYVINEDGRYRLGLQFLELGTGVRATDSLYRIARPEIDRLANASGETASLVIAENDEAVFIYRAGDDVDPALRDGSRVPLYACAAGKAILAHRRSPSLDSLLDGDTPAPTDRTMTTRASLIQELQTVRDQGLAFDRGELAPDRRAVAAAILTDDGRAVGAVTVSGIAPGMSGKRLEEDMPGLVLGTTNRITVEHQTHE